MVSRGLLDTSVFIAAETGRPLAADRLPEESAVSVVTLAELFAGVLAARDTHTRARRMATLEMLADVQTLAVDDEVARIWARLRVELVEAGRRINVNDLWIAATAVRHGVPVVTQDDDFSALEGLTGVTVVLV
jgi:predicted nucleic acid-binding protein